MLKFIISAVPFIFLFFYIFSPVSVKEKTVYIKKGSTVSDMARVLKEEGIIRTEISFILIHIFKRENLKYGEYEFKGLITPFEVYEKISKGEHKLYRIVIPEGSDIFDIGEILEKKGILEKEEFIKAALSEETVEKYGLNTPSMEGFLFPDTYYFSKGISPERIIEVMFNNFLKRTENLRRKLKDKGLSLEEWVIIASLIEKETHIEEEKPIISAVIYNRLNTGMKLQIDPTVIYALKRRGLWKGKLSKEDLKIEDPYNTYVYPGLPPSPICNPGLSSLKAALFPADVDYLYFVYDPNSRRHIFSRTYKEHLKNIKKIKRSLTSSMR